MCMVNSEPASRGSGVVIREPWVALLRCLDSDSKLYIKTLLKCDYNEVMMGLQRGCNGVEMELQLLYNEVITGL